MIDRRRVTAAFRAVVFGSRIDAELAPSALAAVVRDRLERAIRTGSHAETTPLSASYETLLEIRGLAEVDGVANGKLLWYDGAFYRYALYVNDVE